MDNPSGAGESDGVSGKYLRIVHHLSIDFSSFEVIEIFLDYYDLPLLSCDGSFCSGKVLCPVSTPPDYFFEVQISLRLSMVGVQLMNSCIGFEWTSYTRPNYGSQTASIELNLAEIQ